MFTIYWREEVKALFYILHSMNEGRGRGRIQSEPGKRTWPVSISAITQPTDHMSTETEGERERGWMTGRERERERERGGMTGRERERGGMTGREREREGLDDRERERERPFWV